jgi:zinc transport system permease protein
MSGFRVLVPLVFMLIFAACGEEGEAPRTVEDFLESWEYYATGIYAGLAAGAMLGMLGVYVVLRRLVFLSAAIGQTASFGIVLALYLGKLFGDHALLPSPTVMAIGLTALATFGILNRRSRPTVFRDGLLGAMFLLGAAGTELLGHELPEERHQIEGLLHGIGVAVSDEALGFIVTLAAVIGVVHILAWRGFSAVSFDPLGAAIRRVPTRGLELCLSLSLAAAIAGGISTLGALPVFALSVLPPLAAIRMARSLPMALGLGALLGAACAFAGYLASYFYDLPVGACQTVIALLLVASVELVRALAMRLGTKGP